MDPVQALTMRWHIFFGGIIVENKKYVFLGGEIA